MSNMLRIFRYEFMRNVRRRGYIFTTLGIPLILIVISQLSGGLFSGMTMNINPQTVQMLMTLDTDKPVGVIDASGLFAHTPPENIIRYESNAEAEAALTAGEIAHVIYLPEDYAETGDVEMWIPRMSPAPVNDRPLEVMLLNEIRDQVPEAVLTRIDSGSTFNTVNIQLVEEPAGSDGLARSEESDFWVVYVFVIAYMMTAFASTGYLMQSVIEEKQSRIIEILISSVRPMQLLVGKVLANGLLGLLQIGTWVVIGGAVLFSSDAFTQILALVRSTVNLDALTVLVIAGNFILGYLTFAAIFGAVGAISTSTREGPQFATAFILPSVLPLMLLPFFVSDPNATVPTILSMVPLTSPIAMLMRVLLVEVPLWQILVSQGLMLVTALGLFWVAGRMFRMQTLLAGEVPKLRQLPGLIFDRS
jgi:ABC-2 type transport system permease protein